MSENVAAIQRCITRLANQRYVATRPLGAITATRLQVGSQDAPGAPFPIMAGTTWGERDAIYTLQFGCDIPDDWRGQTLALHMDLAATNDNWDIATIEGAVYIDGKALHALDRYHREILLDAPLTTRATLAGEIRLWTGISQDEHTAHALELRRLDEETDHLYLHMRQCLDALNLLAVNTPHYEQLLAALTAVAQQLDLYADDARSPELYAASHAALNTLEEQVQRLIITDGATPPHTTVTGHAHIDVAWLWQLRHTRLKTANTFTTALYHMERYPSFVFTASTPQLYAYVKEDHPDLYARIKEKIAAGQWEAEGATWVEMDTNLPNGESLARQFLVGQRFFRQEFDYACKVLWLPDVFGYSAALPQLIKAAGADYFITTKLSWNDTNRMPADTFWWEGLDGTRVLTHFITAQTSENDPWYTYNADVTPGTLARTWRNYHQKALNCELLVAYGWGDGGGGPTREMVENAITWEKPISPDLPTAIPGRVADFMDRLAAQVGEQRDLPRWVGELYFEYHRGTYTSQGRTKRANRMAERDLHNAEWLASLAQIFAAQPYPYDELSAAWKIVLTHQFHDILPGSSIGAVYADAATNYATVKRATDAVIDGALGAISAAVAAPANALIVCNPTTWQRDGLVVVPAAQANAIALPQQPLSDGQALVQVIDIPPFGYATFAPAANTATIDTPNTLTVSTTLLENRFYRIELNERGQITRLFDKAEYGGVGREVMQPGDRANVFQLFTDKPRNFDAWDIDIEYAQKMWEIDTLTASEVVEQGPLWGALRLEWRYQDRTCITQLISIYADARRIDFVTEVDWQERQTLLKVAFPVDIHSDYATAEIQFGTVQRPTHRNTSWDQARFETCAHKWFDLSEGGYGVAILNDCKYGYDVHERTMRQTLLKGGIFPDPEADRGLHQFTYSLLPHEGNWFSGGVPQAAYALNYPLLTTTKSAESSADMPTTLTLAACDTPNVIVETIKRAEASDALVLRVFECANQRGPFTIHLPFAARRVTATNLLEEGDAAVELSDDGATFHSMIAPYAIKTFVIEH